jgi:hypothetical protein
MKPLDELYPNLPDTSAADIFGYFADVGDIIVRDERGDLRVGDLPEHAIIGLRPRVVDRVLEAVNLQRRTRDLEARIMDAALSGEPLPDDGDGYYVQVADLSERVRDLEEMVVALEQQNEVLKAENLVLKYGKRRRFGW